VRDDDRLVAAVAFSGQGKFKVKLPGDRVKEVVSGDMVSGHRALKGNKVVSRDEIVSVVKA
jgi:hypothetical protein